MLSILNSINPILFKPIVVITLLSVLLGQRSYSQALTGESVAIGKLPIPAGKFAVGTKLFFLKDDSRIDTIQRANRDIILQAWYPCGAHTGDDKMDYVADKRLIDYFIKNQYYSLDSNIFKSFATLKTNSYKNAAPLRNHKHPVLLFTPGWGTSRVNYTSIYEALASNGIIVLSIDPVYESAVVLPNGKAADPGVFPDTTFVSLNKECIRDMKFIVDQLIQPSSSLGKFLSGSVNLNDIGIAGHSYGGNLAMQYSAVDKRIKYSINLDGGDFSFMEGVKLPSPALILRERPNYSDEELIKKGRDPIKWKADSTKSLSIYMDVLNASPQTGYLVRVNKTGHFSFSDAPFLMPTMLTRFLGTYLNPNRNLELISNLMYSFIQSTTDNKRLNDFKSQFKGNKDLAVYQVH